MERRSVNILLSFTCVGTGVLHFTHFLVPFSACLNYPWHPLSFPARNDQKHIETPCWLPLRRSRGSKPNDFKVCEKNCCRGLACRGLIHLYPFVHMFDRLRFHELEVGVAKREVGLIGFSFTYSIISILQWYFGDFGGFWSPTCWNHRNHTQHNSPGWPFRLQVRPEVLSSVDHTQHRS